ncbi:peptidylprolyl isomerase [Sphingomonas naphthae]|uniref:peptidylprolyl isomerase n=1 Tax=Sphingomonas naphthae TaxID=1813468 RepID=A0ABY7TPB1_9SPHN|nr:peptidylprolyl isomerase [Sphingomonas naphthae]WCT74546.1 peptidylprolyl isomerase [Sphingomonas naphthae]
MTRHIRLAALLVATGSIGLLPAVAQTPPAPPRYQPVNPAASLPPPPPPPPPAPVSAGPAAASSAPARPTPASVLAGAPAEAWREVPADRLLVIDFAGGGQVLIELAPEFAPEHVANIITLAQARWFDGIAIVRSQENYVTQWGDPTEKKPLPADMPAKLPAEYERSAAGVPLDVLPYRDTYAATVGYSRGMPAASEGGQAWLAHCYSMVGVGRDKNPDVGTGAELYAVIGHQARALDRNIAVVGRVIAGMEVLSARPRGTGPLGFYTDPTQKTGIVAVRLAADLTPAERPAWQVLRTDTPTFTAWLSARASRQDDFFLRPAGAIDLCTAMPPVRKTPPAGS